jgi:thymidine kinase
MKSLITVLCLLAVLGYTVDQRFFVACPYTFLFWWAAQPDERDDQNRQTSSSSVNSNNVKMDDEEYKSMEINVKKTGCVHLFMGPMFAQKSTELQRHIRQLKRKRISFLVIKHSNDDTRYGPGIVTHDGVRITEDVVSARELKHVIVPPHIRRIFIDEGQFFEDLTTMTLHWAKERNIEVYVFALNATAEGEMWPQIVKLIPWVQFIHVLTTVCACGSDAICTRLKNSNETLPSNAVRVGNDDTYDSHCFHCASIPQRTREEMRKQLSM